MEEINNETNSKKRVRDNSGLDSDVHGSKRVHVEPVFDSNDTERDDSSVPEFNLPEVNDMRNDILDILEDPDVVADRDPEIQDLDSVIRSFEEEILNQAPTSYSGESQPDLGYLLEASDDELGLPPAISPTDGKPMEELTNYDSFVFENEIPSYDPFGFDFVAETESTNDGEYVRLGGWFEYEEEDSDFSEFLWRPEPLPAL